MHFALRASTDSFLDLAVLAWHQDKTDVFQQYVAATYGPQYRFPKYFSLDLRVSKDIQVDPKHAVRLSGTVRNLTNHFNPLEVHSNLADPQYGDFFGNNGRRFVLDFDVLF